LECASCISFAEIKTHFFMITITDQELKDLLAYFFLVFCFS
jgi:hypothetical protein